MVTVANVKTIGKDDGLIPRIYIGRGTPLGNPYPMKEEKERDRVCDDYEQWIGEQIEEGNPGVKGMILYLAAIEIIYGDVIVLCHCAPRRCHGDEVRNQVMERIANMGEINWAKHWKDSGYECSSRGDKRFSALYAMLPDGRTIEEAYQLDVKGYREKGFTHWRDGKGKLPVNAVPLQELQARYTALWEEWAKHNKDHMVDLLVAATIHNCGLHDQYARGPVNQANSLAQILTRKIKEYKKKYDID